MRLAQVVTSGPIPSPGRTTIRFLKPDTLAPVLGAGELLSRYRPMQRDLSRLGAGHSVDLRFVAANFVNDGHQVTVGHVLGAVGEIHGGVVAETQLFIVGHKAEFEKVCAKRVAAGMLTEDQAARGYTDG